jgi:hypothetical protein
MLDLDVIVPRLKQVISWTEYLMQKFVYPPDRQNHGEIFRQINPVINGQPLYTCDRGSATWNLDDCDLDNFEQALRIAVEQREQEIELLDFNLADFQQLGRILYFATGGTLHDGFAIAESNCFVDESDVPPIDTWFFLDRNSKNPALSKDNLFCWIPKRFEPIIQEAINVDYLGSYHWLDKEGPLTHQQIVDAMAK